MKNYFWPVIIFSSLIEVFLCDLSCFCLSDLVSILKSVWLFQKH